MSVTTSPKQHRQVTAGDASGSDQWSRLRREFGWEIRQHAQADQGVWYTERSENIHFPDDSHDDLFRVEDESFWFRHRNQVIEQALEKVGMPDSLWEVGAGNGCVAGHFQKRGLAVTAVEPIADGARNALRRGIPDVVCGRFESLRLPDGSLPAIGCFDVLEHIEQPGELVREFMRVLQPGGVFVATVPALNWLWSDADVISGHFRRYTRRSFRKLATTEGFEAESVDYFMLSLVAPMFCLRTVPSLFSRRACDKEALRRQMDGTADRRSGSPIEWLLRSEAAISRVIPLPMGTSVIGVFRKPLRNTTAVAA